MSGALKVLIVGGYGIFGGRIVALLENAPDLTLIVAGRSLERARAFQRQRGKTAATLRAIAFDRDGDIATPLAAKRPDILVDASGPFQAYGDDRYRIIEACIDLGINYLDLADGSDFVAGVRAFEPRARAAGVFVLSGVSSFPVLTAAVVRHLVVGMTRIDTIVGGIAPSPFAGVGANVIRAIAGYAGQAVPLRRDGVTVKAWPLTDHLRFTIAPPGELPLENRLFSLVDVPDLCALAELWPDVKTIWMGAAPVPEVLHRMVAMLAWLVRLRLIGSLSPLAPLMLWATNHLRWGAHRGGMFVSIDGVDATGEKCRRSWHMIAEGDDGPLIPAMAVEAIARQALLGQFPPPGAREATNDLELEDYHALFAGRSIVSGDRCSAEAGAGPLYARLLGSAWDRLPAEIRAMHASTETAKGRASVERGRGLLSRLVAVLFGFPAAASDTPVSVRFHVEDKVETWTRAFGDRSFSSRQFAGRGGWDGLLCEQFGPLTFALALVAREGRLELIPRGWRFFGVPMPMWLCPGSIGCETVEDGEFHFDVEIRHPLTGLIVRYRGWLTQVAQRAVESARPHGVTKTPFPGRTTENDDMEFQNG